MQIEYPKTGKRGRPKKPKIIPSDDLKYAQVVKTRNGGKLQNVEKKVIFGEDIEQSAISTSLIERQNLTFRQDNNRVRQEAVSWIAGTLPLPFGVILPGCASSVMMGCKAPGTM